MQVYYYSKEDRRAYKIEEGQSIQSANICVDNGEIVEVQKNQELITFIEDEPLEEGEYTIILKNEEETLKRTFKVDNTAPIISGIENSTIRENLTITFENIEDVASAILELPEGKAPIDLYDLYIKGKLEKDENGKNIYAIEYSNENKGQYRLIVKDAATNTYIKDFRIR